MKHHSPKSEARKVKEHKVSAFYEYDLPFNKLAVGVSEIDGRYPQNGFVVDEKVEQVWYVESGSGTVFVGDDLMHMKKGDLIYIPKKKKYWIQGNYLKIVVSSSPPWSKTQHKQVEE